jgi:hypothetical protein
MHGDKGSTSSKSLKEPDFDGETSTFVFECANTDIGDIKQVAVKFEADSKLTLNIKKIRITGGPTEFEYAFWGFSLLLRAKDKTSIEKNYFQGKHLMSYCKTATKQKYQPHWTRMIYQVSL